MPYRPDIDGLRSIAVLSVVLFHAGSPLFPGGFVGVDIFFVISGFLITGLIANDIEAKRFSIYSFYARRIRRIFPALMLVIGLSLIAGAALLLPDEFENLAKSAVSSALFVSNILFWSESGYFGGPASLKPLLHTWTLSVEEQFYIVYPLGLVALAALTRYGTTVVLSAVAAAALIGCIWATEYYPDAAFYLAPFRAWEFLTGAILALAAIPDLRNRWSREAAAMAGLGLIGFSVFTFSEDTPFPGIAALAPCLGAALLIHAGSAGSSIVSQCLSLRPMVFVGLISYSLYLWHWPALVFARIYNLAPLQPQQIAAVLIFAFVGATLSWRYVEQPARHVKSVSRTFGFGFGAIAVVVMVGTAIALMHGLPGRLAPEARNLIATMKLEHYLELYDRGGCFLDKPQHLEDYDPGHCWPAPDAPHPRVIVWGDSYAAHLVPGLRPSIEDGGGSLGQYTATSCRPIFSDHSGKRCLKIARAVSSIASASGGVDIAILAGHWPKFVKKLGEKKFRAALLGGIETAKEFSPRVILVGQSPTYKLGAYKAAIMRPGLLETPEVSLIARDYYAINSLLAEIARDSSVEFYDPYSNACDGTLCPAFRNGQPFHWDGGHMTLEGSLFYAEPLADIIMKPSAP